MFNARRNMITRYLIPLFSLFLLGCISENIYTKHEPNPEAVKFHNEAYEIAYMEIAPSEKLDSAIHLLEKAIMTDSLYLEAHFSIIRFALQKEDITAALNYCHRAQKVYTEFPEFLMIEGVIHALNNEHNSAEKRYADALEIYEKKLKTERAENPYLELDYVICLLHNNQTIKARTTLEALKANNKQDPFFKELSTDLFIREFYSTMIY